MSHASCLVLGGWWVIYWLIVIDLFHYFVGFYKDGDDAVISRRAKSFLPKRVFALPLPLRYSRLLLHPARARKGALPLPLRYSRLLLHPARARKGAEGTPFYQKGRERRKGG